MIRSGDWETKDWKKLNTKAFGAVPEGGHLQPHLKVRTLFKEILIELGFEEMPTNRFVENSFWNFDALFQP
jgi:phenylalanyl-tRNA synthetase alpha chain